MVHTVLFFIVVQQDKENATQLALIDVCVEAGLARLAPGECAGSSPSCLTYFLPCKPETTLFTSG